MILFCAGYCRSESKVKLDGRDIKYNLDCQCCEIIKLTEITVPKTIKCGNDTYRENETLLKPVCQCKRCQ